MAPHHLLPDIPVAQLRAFRLQGLDTNGKFRILAISLMIIRRRYIITNLPAADLHALLRLVFDLAVRLESFDGHCPLSYVVAYVAWSTVLCIRADLLPGLLLAFYRLDHCTCVLISHVLPLLGDKKHHTVHPLLQVGL